MHRITWDSSRGQSNFAHPALTVFGQPFHAVTLALPSPTLRSLNPGRTSSSGLDSSAFARHYLRNNGRFLFLGLLRCFTSPRVAWTDYEFIRPLPPIKVAGLSHSEIHGLTPACGSPWLIAACCVLHRLLAPRHSLCALCSLFNLYPDGC